MTKYEAAVIMSFTGFVTLTGDDIKKYFVPYASKILGHHVGSWESLNDYKRQELQKGAIDDFVKICTRATDTDNI